MIIKNVAVDILEVRFLYVHRCKNKNDITKIYKRKMIILIFNDKNELEK